MKLIDVYEIANSEKILYDLLSERETVVNISHHQMPTWEQHCEFVNSRPYREWFIVINDTEKPVGACYLSKQNEIGVQVFRDFQGRGYGNFAIQAIMYRHADERLLANISPENVKSQEVFKKLGFRLIQYTYEWIQDDHR